MTKFSWQEEAQGNLLRCIGINDAKKVQSALLFLLRVATPEAEWCIKNRKFASGKRLCNVLRSLLVHVHIRKQGLTQEVSHPSITDLTCAILSLVIDLQIFSTSRPKKALSIEKALSHILRDVLILTRPVNHFLWDIILQSTALKEEQFKEIGCLILERLISHSPWREAKEPELYLKCLLCLRLWYLLCPKGERSRVRHMALSVPVPKRMHRWIRSQDIPGMPRLEKKAGHKAFVISFLKTLSQDVADKICNVLSEDISNSSASADASILNKDASTMNEMGDTLFVLDRVGNGHFPDQLDPESAELHEMIAHGLENLPELSKKSKKHKKVILDDSDALSEQSFECLELSESESLTESSGYKATPVLFESVVEEKNEFDAQLEARDIAAASNFDAVSVNDGSFMQSAVKSETNRNKKHAKSCSRISSQLKEPIEGDDVMACTSVQDNDSDTAYGSRVRVLKCTKRRVRKGTTPNYREEENASCVDDVSVGVETLEVENGGRNEPLNYDSDTQDRTLVQSAPNEPMCDESDSISTLYHSRKGMKLKRKREKGRHRKSTKEWNDENEPDDTVTSQQNESSVQESSQVMESGKKRKKLKRTRTTEEHEAFDDSREIKETRAPLDPVVTIEDSNSTQYNYEMQESQTTTTKEEATNFVPNDEIKLPKYVTDFLELSSRTKSSASVGGISGTAEQLPLQDPSKKNEREPLRQSADISYSTRMDNASQTTFSDDESNERKWSHRSEHPFLIKLESVDECDIDECVESKRESKHNDNLNRTTSDDLLENLNGDDHFDESKHNDDDVEFKRDLENNGFISASQELFITQHNSSVKISQEPRDEDDSEEFFSPQTSPETTPECKNLRRSDVFDSESMELPFKRTLFQDGSPVKTPKRLLTPVKRASEKNPESRKKADPSIGVTKSPESIAFQGYEKLMIGGMTPDRTLSMSPVNECSLSSSSIPEETHTSEITTERFSETFLQNSAKDAALETTFVTFPKTLGDQRTPKTTLETTSIVGQLCGKSPVDVEMDLQSPKSTYKDIETHESDQVTAISEKYVQDTSLQKTREKMSPAKYSQHKVSEIDQDASSSEKWSSRVNDNQSMESSPRSRNLGMMDNLSVVSKNDERKVLPSGTPTKSSTGVLSICPGVNEPCRGAIETIAEISAASANEVSGMAETLPFENQMADHDDDSDTMDISSAVLKNGTKRDDLEQPEIDEQDCSSSSTVKRPQALSEALSDCDTECNDKQDNEPKNQYNLRLKNEQPANESMTKRYNLRNTDVTCTPKTVSVLEHSKVVDSAKSNRSSELPIVLALTKSNIKKLENYELLFGNDMPGTPSPVKRDKIIKTISEFNAKVKYFIENMETPSQKEQPETLKSKLYSNKVRPLSNVQTVEEGEKRECHVVLTKLTPKECKIVVERRDSNVSVETVPNDTPDKEPPCSPKSKIESSTSNFPDNTCLDKHLSLRSSSNKKQKSNERGKDANTRKSLRKKADECDIQNEPNSDDVVTSLNKAEELVLDSNSSNSSEISINYGPLLQNAHAKTLSQSTRSKEQTDENDTKLSTSRQTRNSASHNLDQKNEMVRQPTKNSATKVNDDCPSSCSEREVDSDCSGNPVVSPMEDASPSIHDESCNCEHSKLESPASASVTKGASDDSHLQNPGAHTLSKESQRTPLRILPWSTQTAKTDTKLPSSRRTCSSTTKTSHLPTNVATSDVDCSSSSEDDIEVYSDFDSNYSASPTRGTLEKASQSIFDSEDDDCEDDDCELSSVSSHFVTMGRTGTSDDKVSDSVPRYRTRRVTSGSVTKDNDGAASDSVTGGRTRTVTETSGGSKRGTKGTTNEKPSRSAAVEAMPTRSSPRRRSSEKLAKKYSCGECHTVLKTRNGLKVHLRSHTHQCDNPKKQSLQSDARSNKSPCTSYSFRPRTPKKAP